MAGAIIHVYLQQYLLKVAAEPSFSGLPAVLRVPLAQPGFLLGVIFLLFILFGARRYRRAGQPRTRSRPSR